MKKRALLYTQDPSGIEGLAKFLVQDDWEIVSNGEAAKVLSQNNFPYIANEALNSQTQWSDTFLSTLKTIIGTRLDNQSIAPNADNIFLVCINIKKQVNGTTNTQIFFDNTIDLKYITLIRAAAQNYMNVIVLTDPDDYEDTIIQMMTTSMTNDFRLYLAGKALNFTAVYDSAYSNYILFNGHITDFPKNLVIPYSKMRKLSQGSNPNQSACLYTQGVPKSALAGSHKIQGKDISYNLVRNYFIAWNVVSVFLSVLKNPFEVPSVDCQGYTYSTLFTPAVDFVFVVAVKHGNIIGAALGRDVQDAFNKAYTYCPDGFARSCIGCSSVVDKDAAIDLLNKPFYCIIAPDFTKDARKVLAQNKEIRLIVASNISQCNFEIASIDGGILTQTCDNTLFKKWYVVTRRRPTQEQVDALAFGVMINMKLKSDAVTIVNDNTIIGSAVALSSRQLALFCALTDAERSFKNNLTNIDTSAEVLVSDTSVMYYPGDLDRLLNLGIKAILQEGGAQSDDELIAFCNEHNIAMVFTHSRHITF